MTDFEGNAMELFSIVTALFLPNQEGPLLSRSTRLAKDGCSLEVGSLLLQEVVKVLL